MSLQDAIDRATTDPNYAAELKQAALAAATEPYGSAKWTALASHFATDPEGLLELESAEGAQPQWTHTSWTLTTTTLDCGTTTTASHLCPH
jgi:hypothetical protein